MKNLLYNSLGKHQFGLGVLTFIVPSPMALFENGANRDEQFELLDEPSSFDKVLSESSVELCNWTSL